MTTTHPAQYSKNILEKLNYALILEALDKETNPIVVLDPFGGLGGINKLANQDVHTISIEIEEEWATNAYVGSYGKSIWADSIEYVRDWMPFESIDVLATSVVYANGCADLYTGNGRSKRNTYASHLGRLPDERSSAGLGRWSSLNARERHRDFLVRAFEVYVPVVKPGGLILLNLKDPMWTVKGEKHIGAFTAWMWTLMTGVHGCELVQLDTIPTRGLAYGSNRATRTGNEYVLHFRKPTKGRFDDLG